MAQRAVNGGKQHDALRFGVLGPVVAFEDDRALALGAPRQRALLAMLLLDAGRPVSVDRIVDGLWADSPPATVQKMVQLYVSRLRRELGPSVIRTTARGYQLDLGDGVLDLIRFRELVEGSRATAGTDAEAAVAGLREALGLWRGEALADILSEPFARTAAASLEELRLATIEERVELELGLGRHADLVPELEALVADNPLRERFRGQLMLALYRCGRQADALETYRAGRAELVERLGLDPSPSLQRLEAAILRQDAELELPVLARSGAAHSREPVGPEVVRPQPRRALLFVVAAVVASAAAFALYSHVTRAGGPVRVAHDSVAVIDSGSGRVLDDIAVGGDPGAMTVGDGAVWVGSREDRTIVRIDPATHRIEQTYGLAYTPQRIAVARSTVAVANGFSGTVSTIDTHLSFISQPRRLRGPTRGQVAMVGSPRELWLGFQDGTVGAFDPETLVERASVSGRGQPGEMAFGGGKLWMTQILNANLTRISARRVKLVGTTHIEGGEPYVAFGAGAVWVVSGGNNRLWRIDPATGSIVTSLAIGTEPSAIAADGGHVWVGSQTGDVYEVDPATNTLTRSFRVAHRVLALAAIDGRIWVSVGS